MSATENNSNMSQSKQQDKPAFNDLVDRFVLEHDGLSKSSAKTYSYGIRKFGEWLDQQGYGFYQLTPLKVGAFSTWLKDQDLKKSTLESYTKAVRSFLEWAEGYNLIDEGLHENVENIYADKKERQWDQEVDIERIGEIVEVLEDAYAPKRNPLMWQLLAKTGLRQSGLVGLDLEDVKRNGERYVIDVRSRENTKLKGRGDHERVVNISPDLFADLQVYVDQHRIETTDDYGRKPLFTTKNGRVSKGTVVDTSMYYSCPAITGVGQCDCVNPNKHETRECEQSFRPHTLRAYHVTKLRNDGINLDTIGERVACNPDTLELHYERSNKKQQSVRRFDTLESVL